METHETVTFTALIALVLVAACAITYSMTSLGWEKEAIAAGHAHRVIVDGTVEFAWNSIPEGSERLEK